MTSISPSITSSISSSISDSFGDSLPVIDTQVLINELGIQSTAGVIDSWDNQGDPAFDVNVRLGTVANIKPHPNASMLLYGASGDIASTPDSPALELTGTVQTWLFDVYADDYTPSGSPWISSQYEVSGSQRSWRIGFDSSGNLVLSFAVVGAGGTNITANSTESPGFTNGERARGKIERNSTTGDVDFFQLVDSVFLKIGDTVSATSGVLFNSTANLVIGAALNGATFGEFPGAVKSVQVFDDSRLALDFQASDGENKTGVAGDTFVNVFGDELFDPVTDLGSFVTNNSTISKSDGVMTVTNTAGFGQAYQTQTVAVGDSYFVTVFVEAGDSVGTVAVGSTANGSELGTEVSVTGTQTFFVTATSTTLSVRLQVQSATIGHTTKFSVLSVMPANEWTMAGDTFIQNTGHTVVNSIGSAGLETTVGQLITGKTTEFLVAKIHVDVPNDRLVTSRSDGSNRHILFNNAGTWAMFSGATLAFGTIDTDIHLWTAQQNQDSTSKLTVSGEGSVTGSAGTQDFDALTLFANTGGTQASQAFIAEYIIYPRQLSDFEVNNVQLYLTNKWNL